jgi:uncharacterized OB-fold protein
MLKCGQKNNSNYTFGIDEKQMREQKEAQKTTIAHTCPHCGQTSMVKTSFCPNCGEKN